jgi:5-deoxy-glucuronate isomerase
MERLIKAHSNGKIHVVVPPGTMRFLDFSLARLKKGEKHSFTTGPREYVIDIFSGAASADIDGPQGKKSFPSAGGRADVFSGPPAMIYVPPQSSCTLTAASEELDAGIFSAASSSKAPPVLIEGEAVTKNVAGRGNWQRTVYSALDTRLPADRLLAGETLNPPGNWSSYPPHKHDKKNPPNEAVLEEVYFFRIKPAQGFGFIYTYTAPADPDGFSNVYVVHDGDTVLLPKGYHPVVAAPGYELHYTWVLAGEERRYGAWADDPQHAWVKNQ